MRVTLAQALKLAVATCVVGWLAVAAHAAEPVGSPTLRVSVGAGGVQANDVSFAGDVSNDGRLVVFETFATNLVAGGSYDQVVIRDRRLGSIEPLAVSTNGVKGDLPSYRPMLSADGRIAAFWSDATNLVLGDKNGFQDVFVRNLKTKVTSRVSVGNDGQEANDDSVLQGLADSGRLVLFASQASNLVPGDTNNVLDLFVRDRRTDKTLRASIGSNGEESLQPIAEGVISGSGRHVAFVAASDLVAGGSATTFDIFVRDLVAGRTSRVKVDGHALSANAQTDRVAISDDGHLVAFTSAATNLLSGMVDGRRRAYLADRRAGTLVQIRTPLADKGTDGDSDVIGMSSDGRTILFQSTTTTQMPGSTGGASDVFAYDRLSGQVRRLSLGAGQRQSNGPSTEIGAISGNGAFIVFTSDAANLVPNDTNRTTDVFLRRLDDPPSSASSKSGPRLR